VWRVTAAPTFDASYPFERSRFEPVTYRCRETGTSYGLEIAGHNYVVSRRGGEIIGRRCDRHDALELIKQTAALDFLTAQSESAFAGVEGE
jgi:hypothetical protein